MVLTEVLAEARHLESSERCRYVCLVVRVYKHRPCIQLLAGGRGRKGLNSEREREEEKGLILASMWVASGLVNQT